LGWALGFGALVAAGVEGTGSYGAAESLRALRVARRSAVKARTQAANQLHALVSTASERLKAGLRGLQTKQLVERVRRRRHDARPGDPTAAAKFALRSVARRHRVLSEEIAELEEQIERLAREAAPELTALDGVGPDTAATLLIAAGDNPERLRSEAAFAHLCGAAPVSASSGKVVRHRLNPAATATPTGRSTWSRSTACGATSAPELTSPGAPPRARARRRRCGV
jgi:transposase